MTLTRSVTKWISRTLVAVLAVFSMLGFLNAFVFRVHGPGVDLGVVAGVVALTVFVIDRRLQ